MPSILFIAAHKPDRSPSQRFRFEQYFAYLKEANWFYDFSFLLNEKDGKAIYRPGKYHEKLLIFIKSVHKRLRDLRKAKRADIVFVQREAFMTGNIYFEKQFSKRAKLIFDFDDAIWLHDVNPNQGLLNRLKDAGKTSRIIKMADLVIAGNEYLASYARRFNEKVVIIPTTIDTQKYQKMHVKKGPDKICIGWSGSFSTLKHFETVVPALQKIKEKYGNRVYFKVIGDETYRNESLGIKGLPWKERSEIEDLSEIDIGMMPLPDDEWSKGKCGLKGLQYMALEIPAVMSPVGVNTTIVQDGKNGMLASSQDEWVDKLSRLIELPELRTRLGKNGRITVIEEYSVEANAQKYLDAFSSALGSAS